MLLQHCSYYSFELLILKGWTVYVSHIISLEGQI